MREWLKGAAAWLCAALICFSCAGARAEFSPRLEALKADGRMEAELYGSFETLEPFSEESLAVVNDWLSRIRLTLSLQESANRTLSKAAIAMDGAALFSAATQAQSAYTLTVFSPSGGAYLTAPGKPDALTLLSGEEQGLPSLTGWREAYPAWAAELYPLLEQKTTPKKSKSATSIKNASASASYENYILTGEEMNAAWPEILDTLLPVLQKVLSDSPARCAKAEELLKSLEFSGECRFKRFLDKEGGDMGLQFTGKAAQGEDVRKVTLFGGYTPGKGGYVSLALPAVSGKNNFKITLTGKLTEKAAQNTLSLEGTYTRTLDGETTTAELTANLKNALKNGDEDWSGKVTINTKIDGVKNAWTITPDLTFTAAGLQGQIALVQKTDGDQRLKAALSLTLKAGEELQAPETTAAKDLREMGQEQAKAVAAEEMTGLTTALMRLLAALPAETRNVLTHEMRTEEWMTAPAVPVPDGSVSPSQTEDHSWIVEEEDQ